MRKALIIIVSIFFISCSSSYKVIRVVEDSKIERPVIYIKKINSQKKEVFEICGLPQNKYDNNSNLVLIEEGEVYKIRLKKKLKMYWGPFGGSNKTVKIKLRDSLGSYLVNGEYYSPNLYGKYLKVNN